MRDEVNLQGDTAPGFISISTGSDPSGRLEPLAVPLWQLLSILRRHIWLMLTVLAVGIGGTAMFVRQLPKQYTASATILVQPQRTQVSDLQAISSDATDINGLIRTQIDLLRSPALAMNVVKSLDLTSVEEFNPHGGGLMTKIRARLQRYGLLPPAPELEPEFDDQVQIAGIILSGKLSFANEAKSSVLSVSVTTQSPKLSAEIANEVAKKFLDFKRQEKFAAMQRAHDWFQDQMGKLAVEVSSADRAIVQFRHEHGLEELPPDDGTASHSDTITRDKLKTISQQMTQIAREIALKQGQLAQARAVMRGDTPPDKLSSVIASPPVIALLTLLSQVAGHEAQLASSQGGGNPELLSVRAQRQKMQARLEREMANVVASLDNDIKAEQAQTELLHHQVDQVRSAVSKENSALTELGVLQTKARALRSIYESFVNRATQLANVAGIQEQDASLVSSARPPLGPSSPQTTRWVGVAGLLSLVLSIALACLIERLRSGFSMPEQVEATLGIPLVTVVPTVSRATLRGRNKTKADVAFAASFDKVRAQIRTMGEKRPKVIMIASAMPGEGKTTFAIGLARNAAAAGMRVILVECDFRCPSLARQIGLQPNVGLRDILSTGLLGETGKVIREPEPRLHVLPAGRAAGDPQEMLASKPMHALLDSMSSQYDLVLLDTPPVLPVSDALVLAEQADATFIVVHWEKTARAPALDAARLLHNCRANVIGAIMTRVNLRTAVRLGGRMSYAFGHYRGYHLSSFESRG
jgi:succinoglycan biosynthesis transport protein ExoP